MPRDLFRLGPENQGPYLVGARCKRCQHISFPARQVCPACGLQEIEEVPIGRRGKIRSSAVVQNAPTGFSVPYVLALVDLEEGPTVFCPVTDCPPREDATRPGTEVELIVSPARPEGRPVFQYRPIKRLCGNANETQRR